ncbi:MAG: ABC transporter ATP-binding protein [Myxococcaceae bacterium]|nr:ABC transporter ATP-binding protein [Myxococcaceae bacterium]
MARLEVDRLGVAKVALPLLEGVSFTLEAGETVGLVGESGSGKTLTALAILGLLPKGLSRTDGQVRLDGQPLDRERARRAVAMVLQDASVALDPVATVGAQLEEGFVVHRGLAKAQARVEAAKLLEQVGVSDPARRLTQYPHQLSGGMRQRVLLACALAGAPQVLIADEPTTALDVTVQAQLLALLARVRDQRGLALLLITHDLGVVAQACDRVVVLYGGRVCEVAKVAELFDAPRHPYTRGLLESRPAPWGKGAAIAGTVPRPGEDQAGCRFRARCPRASPECAQSQPPLQGDGGHLVACHHPLERAP